MKDILIKKLYIHNLYKNRKNLKLVKVFTYNQKRNYLN